MRGLAATIVLLAAGESSRLGQPKQLLRLGQQTLLRRAATEALALGRGPVVVVLGAEAERLQAELAGLRLQVCINEEWKEGMGSSIRAGVEACLASEPETSRILIMLCDQPAVDRNALAHLLALHEEAGCPVTACAVEGRVQAPAVFEARLFGRLLQLRGDQGARELLRGGEIPVALVDLPQAALDVDRPEDLKTCRRRREESD